MSPYRVRVNVDGRDCVFSSMISSDKENGRKFIYIVEKSVGSSVDSFKGIAHKQTSRKNSTILAKYEAERSVLYRRYNLIRHIGYDKKGDKNYLIMNVSENEFTLSDCLRSAMNNFCELNGYTILEEL